MSEPLRLRTVEPEEVVAAARAAGPVVGFARLTEPVPGAGTARDATAYARDRLGLPDHLAFALEALVGAARQAGEALPGADALASIPFHDVCYGLLLPLSGLAPGRARRLFGRVGPGGGERLDGKQRRALVTDLLRREDLGLDLVDKAALVGGDPFLGRSVATSLNVLLDVLATLVFDTSSALRERLGRVGDVQELFVELCPRHRSSPPLTTREVLLALRPLKGVAGRAKKAVLRSLFERAGRLETFFLAGFLRRGSRISQSLGDDALLDALAEVRGLDRGRLDVARSLVDVFELAALLRDGGEEALADLAIRPLAPVGPMLAGAEVPRDQAFPVLFEKKYDGVRLMLHKATHASGAVRAAAFTRRRIDWTEQLPGVRQLAWALPCRDAIVDGELHGFVPSELGPRPATVYDVLRHVRGEAGPPLRLRFSAFDLIYLDGHDLTGAPLTERRARLAALLAPAAAVQLPLPVELSDGEPVSDRQGMLRLYELFRSQGYEGGIAKDPASTYALARRSDAWTKLKPAITLDLAVTGALHSTSAEGPAAAFGTYLISALDPEQTAGLPLTEVGRVQGLGAQDTARVVQTIFEEGLLTGRTLERDTSSGRKAGVELRPGIVATVRFEGVVKEDAGRLALRDPKIVRVRTGEKDLTELDTVRSIEQLWQKQRLS